jgi:hypothetical protein
MSQERQGMLSCSFSASVLEIYNEQIFDLLVGGRTTGEGHDTPDTTQYASLNAVLRCSPRRHAAQAVHQLQQTFNHTFLLLCWPGDKLDVKAGPDGMYVPGLRVEAVRSYEEVATVLSKGKQARSTMATNMNEHSSRSHLVLSLYATVSNTLTGGAGCMRGMMFILANEDTFWANDDDTWATSECSLIYRAYSDQVQVDAMPDMCVPRNLPTILHGHLHCRRHVQVQAAPH